MSTSWVFIDNNTHTTAENISKSGKQAKKIYAAEESFMASASNKTSIIVTYILDRLEQHRATQAIDFKSN